MAYSKLKLKSTGDKPSLFYSVLMGNASDTINQYRLLYM
jgi:hypothetical protein